jgi:serine/threonine protein kinase
MTAPTIFCNECGASNPLQATYCFACNNPLQPVASSPLLQVQAVSINVAVPASMVIGPLFPSYLLHSRYTIVSQIGTGGFGAVYQAKDTIPLGSKGYAAPEQYGKAQTTHQTDIYGLGATLHQLLTGDDPSLTLFHFKPVQVSKKKMLPIASQLNAFLEQMLEMEMSKRPASMGDRQAGITAPPCSADGSLSELRTEFLAGSGQAQALFDWSCQHASTVPHKYTTTHATRVD